MEKVRVKKKSCSDDDTSSSLTEVDSLLGDYCFPDREKNRTISFDGDFVDIAKEQLLDDRYSFSDSMEATALGRDVDTVSDTNNEEEIDCKQLSDRLENVVIITESSNNSVTDDDVVDGSHLLTSMQPVNFTGTVNVQNESGGSSTYYGNEDNVSTATNRSSGYVSQQSNVAETMTDYNYYSPTVASSSDKENELQPFTESELYSLYYNQELCNYEIFVNDFVENEVKSGKVIQHRLYQLLTNYLGARKNWNRNMITFKSLHHNYILLQENIWSVRSNSITEHGECQDGNPVACMFNYKTAEFNQTGFSDLSTVIDDLQAFTSEPYISSIFNVQLYKMKVECYVQNLCYYFSYLPHNAAISLHTESSPRGPIGTDYKEVIAELKDAVSVLFSFQRRPIKNDDFLNETKAWLEKLLGVLLRIASPDDHLFILSHVMRCPSGIGGWASRYVQQPSFSNGSFRGQYYLDHLITVLGVILLPIKDRELFLTQMEIDLEENDTWEIIDSDVEDSLSDSIPKFALKERDAIALLNQIPFGDIFRQVLLVRYDQDVIDVNVAGDRDMLRAIAVSTLLVTLLEKGLANYDALVYRQFCKRLCLLIKHTTYYITDYWQMFREAYLQRSLLDWSMLRRLQTEYDEFIMRAAYGLYLAQNRIGWQYLATLPFNMITSQKLWRLYQYLLHTNSDSHNVTSKEFIESIENFPDNDVYYFLTTVTNMALDRQLQDWLFIQVVTSQLFQIGFVNPVVRDNCMKSVRSLLRDLTTKHPSLISDLIMALKKDFSLVGKSSLYLFKELPLSLWKPSTVDITVITDWLLSRPISSSESHLARYIIVELNWSTDSNNIQLFLPRELHFHVAIIVVRAVITYAEEISNVYNVPQGVTQLVRSIQTPEQILTAWAWKVISKLRIHLMDQSDQLTRTAITNPQSISVIPNINSDSSDMQILSNAITRNQSIAYYVALLSTDVGHSLPIISEVGFKYCIHLLSIYKYSQTLHIVSLIIPYFFESFDYVLSSDQFRQVIKMLINADRTYMKIAKSYITPEFPGTVLLQLASLIEYQMYNYSRYNLKTAEPVMEFWLRVLCSVWCEDYNSIVFLMDRILCTALFDSSMKPMAIDILSNLIQDLSNKDCNTNVSTWFNWISSNTSKSIAFPASLLPPKLSRVSHSPYFMYFGISLEEYNNEIVTDLWTQLLKNLEGTSGKTNIDATLKKTCSGLNLAPLNSNFLTVYRWSQCALDIDVKHPILPIVWQRFFTLYLQRVPGSTINCSVGSKFFEGTINSKYQGRLKKKLQECLEYTSKIDTKSDAQRSWFNNLSILYRMYLLWLEETRLQESIYLPSLPAQYSPQKLESILIGDDSPWIDYVDFDQIREQQADCLNRWNRLLHRDNISCSNVSHDRTEVDVAKRIMSLLNSYDAGFPPPPLIITHPVTPTIPRDVLINKTALSDYLAERFNTLIQFKKGFKMSWSDQTVFSKKLLEALRQLYAVVEREIKMYASCDTDMDGKKTVSSLTCAGSALLRVKVQEATKDNAIERKIDECNTEFDRLLKYNIRSPPIRLIQACIVLQQTTEKLITEKDDATNVGDEAYLTSLFEVGVHLFYKISSFYDTAASSYFPTKELMRRIVYDLGRAFIAGNRHQCFNLMSIIMKNGHLADILLPHFTPSCSSTADFVRLYEIVVQAIPNNSQQLILNFMSRFDVNEWLQSRCRLSERSMFIEIISNALKQLGCSPSESLLPIHKALRTHLCQMLVHEFPEHYGEILNIILKCSEEEKLANSVWFDVLNCLVLCVSSNDKDVSQNAPIKPGLSLHQIRDIARKFAASQQKLTCHELAETANVLGSHFVRERSRFGLYGLYPKYNKYIDPLLALHGMVGHSFIASMLQMQRGTLADKMCEQMWPVLINLFSPWILPYFTSGFHEPIEAWVQQLINDRSVLPPWIEDDGPIAFKMVAIFTECLTFILDALPASNIILQYVCQWYLTNFAQKVIQEHILVVIHKNLLHLPWSRFLPNAEDLEAMLRVVDQYLPTCHSFLGSVFMDMPWHVIAYKDATSQSTVRIYNALLHLLIKLANEPKLRQSVKVSALLIEAQHFSWNLVEASNYEPVINWFIINYDPRVVLQVTDEDWNAIDMSAFDLLQVAAGFVPSTVYHPTTLQKRQIFIRSYVKMILLLSKRYKTTFASDRVKLLNSLNKIFDKMESIVSAAALPENRGTECGMLLTEILSLINQPNNNVLSKITTDALLNWLTHRAGNSAVLQGLFNVIGSTITNYQQLGIILEASISAWFKNSAGMEEYDWDKLLSIFHITNPLNPIFEESLLSNNQLLSLYTLALKELEMRPEGITLAKVVRWSTRSKLSVDIESKLPLLWSLIFKTCAGHKSEIMDYLMDFSNYLQQLTQLKQGWALLGVIGLNKQTVPSMKCKLLCNAINAFILAKLLVEKDDLEKDHGSEARGSGSNSGRNIRKNSLTGSECMKSIVMLDGMMTDKQYVEYKVIIELAIDYIRSDKVNLYMGDQFVIKLANLLYTDGYIHAFPVDNLNI